MAMVPLAHRLQHQLTRGKQFAKGNFSLKGSYQSVLERTYKPHYHYKNFSPLANGTDLNREKYAILKTHWH